MKKILFFVMAAALFCGCKKEDGGGDVPCPVAGVEMPSSSADNPIKPGAEITLQGKGFTQNSEIWLRGSDEARAADVKAKVTDVTASSITFEAPEVYGAQTVVLKQDGGEWSLGSLTFTAQPEEPEPPVEDNGILPDKVSVIRVIHKDDKSDYVTEYAFSYDEQGRIAKLVTTEYETDILTTTYTYSDNQITAEANGNGYIQSQVWRYELTDGIISGYEVETVGGKSGSEIINTVTLKYDNGHITAVEGTQTNEDNITPWNATITEKLVFTDNTLTKYSTTDTRHYPNSDDDIYSFDVDFVPGPLNNLNIDIMGIDWIGEYLYTSPAYLMNMGGNRSLRLPESIHASYIDGNTNSKDEEYTNEFEYEMNGEYISSIKISRDGQIETIIEIDYEK